MQQSKDNKNEFPGWKEIKETYELFIKYELYLSLRKIDIFKEFFLQIKPKSWENKVKELENIAYQMVSKNINMETEDMPIKYEGRINQIIEEYNNICKDVCAAVENVGYNQLLANLIIECSLYCQIDINNNIDIGKIINRRISKLNSKVEKLRSFCDTLSEIKLSQVEDKLINKISELAKSEVIELEIELGIYQKPQSKKSKKWYAILGGGTTVFLLALNSLNPNILLDVSDAILPTARTVVSVGQCLSNPEVRAASDVR